MQVVFFLKKGLARRRLAFLTTVSNTSGMHFETATTNRRELTACLVGRGCRRCFCRDLPALPSKSQFLACKSPFTGLQKDYYLREEARFLAFIHQTRSKKEAILITSFILCILSNILFSMERFIALASIGCLVSGVRGDEYAPVYQTGSEPVLQEAQDYYQPPASQVYYNRPKQDNFLDDGLGIIGLAGALGIGGLIGGFALIQQAAIAREQIRSQISADTAVVNAINSLLPTQTAAITSLTTAQTTITNQATSLCNAAAAVVAAIPVVIADDAAAGVLEPIINAVINAFMSNSCP